MRKITLSLMVAASLVYSANFDIGVSGSDKGITGFTLSVGEYYRAPIEEIRVIRRSLSPDELSVVYFLARKANRSPEYITRMRIDGRSWWQITISLGLEPRDIYVVETSRHSGPPYGKAYGHHKKHGDYRLSDGEIVELVNTRFLASYHRVSADEIIDRRKGGRSYSDIDDDFRASKIKNKHKDNGKKDKDERGHGRGHDKERD